MNKKKIFYIFICVLGIVGTFFINKFTYINKIKISFHLRNIVELFFNFYVYITIYDVFTGKKSLYNTDLFLSIIGISNIIFKMYYYKTLNINNGEISLGLFYDLFLMTIAIIFLLISIYRKRKYSEERK